MPESLASGNQAWSELPGANSMPAMEAGENSSGEVPVINRYRIRVGWNTDH
jgi:hypothetical protein